MNSQQFTPDFNIPKFLQAMKAQPSKRKDNSYYWIKIENQWEIMMWNGEVFCSVWIDTYKENDPLIQEIDENIIPRKGAD